MIVLWLPSQALFESDGRAFVYVRTPQGFAPKDGKLVKRSESQAVITGIAEGELVVLSESRPEHQSEQGGQGCGLRGVMKVLTK